jgi:hypothetical protein
MFSHVKRKFRSQHGASLSMALMLFLVCTTVASIVLAAGSAAAGRISQIKQMEKSYCNVTSAAELFWDELNRNHSGAEVHIVRACNKLNDSLVPSADTGYSFTVDGEANPTTLFQKIACDLVFGTSTTLTGNTYPSYGSVVKSSLQGENGTLGPILLSQVPSPPKMPYGSLAVKSSDARLADVSVGVVREEDGDLTFTFDDDGNQSFHATLTAKLGVNDLEPRVTRELDGTYTAEYETVITWDGESLTTGGVSS